MHSIFRIFTLLLMCMSKEALHVNAYQVLCGHGKDVYTLNCRLNEVLDNTTLTKDFPAPLKPLAPYVEQISISTSQFSSLPSDIFELFPSLSSLTVYAGLTNLTQRDFQNATQLATLKLGLNNHIAQLESSLFASAPALEYLELAYNDIVDIGDNVFGTLAKLQFLYLEGNGIVQLRNNTFVGATKLQMLELSRNEISVIEDDAFAGLPDLKILMLNRNHITILQTPIFAALRSLERVDMSLNQIAEIEDGVFDGTEHLEFVELGFNNLTQLQSSVFNGAKNLSKLYMAWNRLESINHAFDGLTKLILLDMSFNELNSINASAFSNQTKLEQLELRATGLTKLPIELLQRQTELRVLDLSLNNLSMTDRDFEAMRPLQRLQVLKLENTSVIGITDNLRIVLPELRFINLANNEMDCDGVHALVDFFTRHRIEYEFGVAADVGCTLLPYSSPAIQAYQLSNSKFLHVKEVLGPDYVDPLPPRPWPPAPPPGTPPAFFPGADGAPDDEPPLQRTGQDLFSFDLNPQSLVNPPRVNASMAPTNATSDSTKNSTIPSTTDASVQLLNDTDAIRTDLQSKSIYLFNIGQILSEFTNDTINTPLPQQPQQPQQPQLPPQPNESINSPPMSVDILQTASGENSTSNATQVQADLQTKSIYLFNIAKIISDFAAGDVQIVNALDDVTESTEYATIATSTNIGSYSPTTMTTIHESNSNELEFESTTTLMVDLTEEAKPNHYAIDLNNVTEPIVLVLKGNITPLLDAHIEDDEYADTVAEVVAHRTLPLLQRGNLLDIKNDNVNHSAKQQSRRPLASTNNTNTPQTFPKTNNGDGHEPRPQLGTLKDKIAPSKSAARGKIRYQTSSLVASNNQNQNRNNRISRKNSQLRNRGRIKFAQPSSSTPSNQ